MSKSLKAINKVPFAPVVAIAFGLVTAALTFAIPAWRFTQMIVATGLPGVLSAARPPLGDTARALVAITVGLSVCAVLWIGLSVLRAFLKRSKPGRAKARGTRIDPVIVDESKAALNSAGQRSPIFAERDLGAPFMSDEVLGAKRIEAVVGQSPLTTAAEDEELVLETSWSEAVPSAFGSASEVVALREAPPAMPPEDVIVAPPVAMPTSVKDSGHPMANQALSDLIVRLDTAVEARSKREVIRPSGDILSLRQALDGLFESRISMVKD